MNIKILNSAFFAAAALTFFPTASAFADCDDIGSNQWNQLSEEMTKSYDIGDYESALMYGKSLSVICDRSPIVNYTLSEIYKKLGRESEGYNYVRRATEFANDYNLPQSMLEKIWLARAEQELPHKKQLEECKLDLETQETAFKEEIIKQNTESSTMLTTKTAEHIDFFESRMNTVMWIGAGSAMFGAAATIAGGVMAGVYHKKASDEWDKGFNVKWTKFNDYNELKTAGYAIMGVGIASTIIGSAVAIYSKLKLIDLQKKINESTNISFNVAPNAMMIDLTF